MIENPHGKACPDLPPGLGAPARRALAAAGITRVEQCAGWTQADLRKLHGMGPKAMETLRTALHATGQAFAKPGSAEGVSD